MKKFVAAILAGMIGLTSFFCAACVCAAEEPTASNPEAFVSAFNAIWPHEKVFDFRPPTKEEKEAVDPMIHLAQARLDDALALGIFRYRENRDKYMVVVIFRFDLPTMLNSEEYTRYAMDAFEISLSILCPEYAMNSPRVIKAASIASILAMTDLLSETLRQDTLSVQIDKSVDEFQISAVFTPEGKSFFVAIETGDQASVVSRPPG